ncbi:MAG: SRPBCC domain-containing protein, partial [Terricaulis sp.]
TIWTPGERLAFTWRPGTFAADQTTYVDVRFEPAGDETRVTVEHRGWAAIPQEHVARHGFPLAVFQMRQAEHWRALLASLGGRIDERPV